VRRLTESLAEEIDRRISALSDRRTESIRGIRREYSRRLRERPATEVLELADALVDRHRWVAYELLYHHPTGLSLLDIERVERLGRGIADWGSVDAFGRYVSGPAWLRGIIPDEAVRRWAESRDRWWRRAALVSTVPLNLRTAGGTGDARRTLDICGRLAADRDDMVVKALSWALRALVAWDPEAVRGFLEAQGDALAPRVRREVQNKLTTGLKRPTPPPSTPRTPRASRRTPRPARRAP
jgi:3-methyladenine DNA glycosylase AlkD